MSRDGTVLFKFLPGDNCVTVTAVDGDRDVIESIEADDVCVSALIVTLPAWSVRL